MSQAAVEQKQQASLETLLSRVIAPGLCVACGACVGLCPHLIFFDGRVAAPDQCGLENGRCLDLCPVAGARGNAPAEPQGGPLGPVLGVWWARATDEGERQGAQYGGVVSSLLGLALENGLVEEAVVTGPGKRGAPQGMRVKDRQGVKATAGSIYAAGGALGELNRALAEPDTDPLAAVGLPCQCQAMAAMKAHPRYPQAGERLALTIGLFCTMNLDARILRKIYCDFAVEGAVTRGDFPPPPAGVYQVWAENGATEIPLEKVNEARLAGCALCPDLTAETADVSVGAAEGREGWNTLLVRTEKGRELVEAASRAGLLEMEEMPAESRAHLETAAGAKRQRAAARRSESRDA